jgi:hypothetical protein
MSVFGWIGTIGNTYAAVQRLEAKMADTAAAVTRLEASFKSEADRVNADLTAFRGQIDNLTAMVEDLKAQLAATGDPALVDRINAISDALDGVDVPAAVKAPTAASVGA